MTLLFENVTARVDGADLVGVTMRHESGILAVVGAPSDGASALLAVAAGAARARGRVTRPERIGYVPLRPELPEAVRVREILELASAMRGEPARANERLAAFGIESLSARDTRTLSTPEARAVLACEALTSEKIELACIEEPLAFIAPCPMARMIRAAKATVLASTASPSDARAIADRFAILRKGRLLAITNALDPMTLLGTAGARLVVATSDAHAIATHLADRSIRVTIEGSRLVLEGPDPAALSREAQRAIVLSSAPIESLRIEPLALEPLQAVATAEATAAYEGALARARAAAAPPMPIPAPMPMPAEPKP